MAAFLKNSRRDWSSSFEFLLDIKRKFLVSLGLRKTRVHIQKKSVEPCSTLILITWGPCKALTFKKNDLAHAEYVYTPIHYGTPLAITANRCTIDARRNTHSVGIRHILVLGGRKFARFQVTKTSVNKRLFIYVLVGISPTRPPSGYTGATLPSHPRRGYCLSFYSPINRGT